MVIGVFDDVIKNPDEYVKDILNKEFVDIDDGPDKVFKGIQLRDNDEFAEFAEKLFPRYSIVYNFVRQSPLHQVEPNFIHSDDMMGDKTMLLYLNKYYPQKAGTTIYDNNLLESCIVKMKYNRVFTFDSHYKHSRNIIDNFGEKENSRLVQVIFLKLK